MSAPNSRKRAAPGSAPMVPYQQQQQVQQPFTATGGIPSDQLMRWNMPVGGDGQVFPAGAGYEFMQAQPQLPQGGMPQATPSNSLARRQSNRALVPTNNRVNYNNSVEPWTGMGDEVTLLPNDQSEEITSQDNVEVLEEMAQKAKRDSQAKRKQIPPFVQKLSSFLEQRKNEDLIRWSEKGDSFIVLDEDEFAKTLIPELFKHNNYASFVRQLNMYGFHKRVGLSDNSMRASERKNKSPSEYSNPFFRRGHPNLLWLINKPKSKSKGSSGREKGDGESDDEVIQEDVGGQAPGPSTMPASARPLPPATGADGQPLPKKELTVVREEISKLREQQKMILGAINRLQRNNNDLYNQAIMFQSQHDRHQNSINAILSFLANVFRKTLEDQGSTQNVSDIISSLMTSQGGQASHAGNVVDLGDYFQSQPDHTGSMAAPHKRARGLLPPIPDYNNNNSNNSPQPSSSRGASATRSPSAGTTPHYRSGAYNPEPGHVTELVDGQSGETPPNLRQELENNPHERMMKIINDHNATNNSGLDLPEAAELVANVPNTLNNDQRSKLVDFMAQSASPSDSVPAPAPAEPSSGMHGMPSNSRVSPTPAADQNAAPSLSPIMRSPPMQPPSLRDISNNQIDLDQLQRLQREQDAKISELGELLGPLSPSGHVPGLGNGVEPPYFDQGNVDLDQYLNSNAFLNDASFDNDGNDFNFNLDADGTGQTGNLGYQTGHLGVDEGHSSGNKNNTPSPTGTEEIPRTDFGAEEEASYGNKKRRVA